jgi:CubicO group peptidase (beta-lactamase class C family)
MDASVQARMQEFGAPGAAVAIVRDGEIVYRGAFGLADVAGQKPVSFDDTLFRIASISKTFTALAAAQLAERGRLDLDADIATYLEAETPATPRGPVTMRQLLTHVSGFDGNDIGDAVREAGELSDLSVMLVSGMTQQTTTPGALYRYTNQGYGLAGRVIEIAGEGAFADYMRDEILRPLEMNHSSFAQPAPPELESALAIGHTPFGHAPLPRDFTRASPGDGLITTAADMANYMLFQLGAREQGATVLADLSAMHARQFAHTNGAPAMALGWAEQRWNGRRILSHTGGQLGFTSYVGLFPDDQVGFFIVVNARAGAAREAVLADFVTEFMPWTPRDYAEPTPIAAPHDVSDYAGRYLSLDYPRAGFSRAIFLLGLAGRRIEVAGAEAGLSIDAANYVETAPDTFSATDGSFRVVQFERDGAGAVTRA